MKKPIAFMSYARRDDKVDAGLTKLREQLSMAVSVEIGEDFEIFQDRKDVQWGQNWKARIEETIDEVTFLIPIVTPSFFNSDACKEEFGRFLAREEKLGRDDLILPIYYRSSSLLDDEARREADDLAREIHRHNHTDWRELRSKPFDSEDVRRELEKLGCDIRDALELIQGSQTVITDGQDEDKPWLEARPPSQIRSPLHALPSPDYPPRSQEKESKFQREEEQLIPISSRVIESHIMLVEYYRREGQAANNQGEYERAIQRLDRAIGYGLDGLRAVIEVGRRVSEGA